MGCWGLWQQLNCVRQRENSGSLALADLSSGPPRETAGHRKASNAARAERTTASETLPSAAVTCTSTRIVHTCSTGQNHSVNDEVPSCRQTTPLHTKLHRNKNARRHDDRKAGMSSAFCACKFMAVCSRYFCKCSCANLHYYEFYPTTNLHYSYAHMHLLRM